jgi:hypothetical protein
MQLSCSVGIGTSATGSVRVAMKAHLILRQAFFSFKQWIAWRKEPFLRGYLSACDPVLHRYDLKPENK